MKNIHIGSIIEQKVKESSMSNKEFAKRINYERSNVYHIFKQKSIDSELLIRISEVLNFDFYNEIYLDKKTNHFSKKVLIAIEVEEKSITNLDLPGELIKLLPTD